MKGFVEHPELTPESLAAVNAAFLANGFEGMEPSFADRRFLAAFLREAMYQVERMGALWPALRVIAASLHSLPPPPPTLAEAREAARQLAGSSAAVVHAYLDTLQEVEQ